MASRSRTDSRTKSVEKPFLTDREAAGLSGTGVSLHTLRHTFASSLVMAGVDLITIQEYGGWTDLSLVQRYAHLSAGHKAKAIEMIAERFHNTNHDDPISGTAGNGCQIDSKRRESSQGGKFYA